MQRVEGRKIPAERNIAAIQIPNRISIQPRKLWSSGPTELFRIVPNYAMLPTFTTRTNIMHNQLTVESGSSTECLQRK